MIRRTGFALLLSLVAMPSLAEAPQEKEALCKTFVEKAIPDYAQEGLDGVVNKNKGKVGLHCKPMFAIPAKISHEQLLELREQAYRSCLDDAGSDVEKIKGLLASIPEDC